MGELLCAHIHITEAVGCLGKKKRISLSDILTGEYREFGMHDRSIIKVARGLHVHSWLQMLHR